MWQRFLLDWYRQNKRDLLWRRTSNPYHIWVSEIMLQQTRVETVKDYYYRFLERLPAIADLASVPEDELMKLWEGLGYYSRARNLQKAAQVIMETHQGQFPQEYGEIIKLPGIGPYTAGAVASIAFGKSIPAIDGNVYRVMTRFLGIREPIERPSVQQSLYYKLSQMIPMETPGDFNQALMELGATLCSVKSPQCETCPISQWCNAYSEGDVLLLPIHEKKAPPKEVDICVLLLTYQGRILISKRSEKLLHGLYTFLLLENCTSKKEIKSILDDSLLSTKNIKKYGEAKHVFTHRIWNMKIYHAALQREPQAYLLQHSEASLVDLQELINLPFPKAVSAAYRYALALLQGE